MNFSKKDLSEFSAPDINRLCEKALRLLAKQRLVVKNYTSKDPVFNSVPTDTDSTYHAAKTNLSKDLLGPLVLPSIEVDTVVVTVDNPDLVPPSTDKSPDKLRKVNIDVAIVSDIPEDAKIITVDWGSGFDYISPDKILPLPPHTYKKLQKSINLFAVMIASRNKYRNCNITKKSMNSSIVDLNESRGLFKWLISTLKPLLSSVSSGSKKIS